VVAVRIAGYEVTCTMQTGCFGSETDLLEVRRVHIFSNDKLSAFTRKVVFTDHMSWNDVARYIDRRIQSRFV
jgi:hypothetical protein